MFGHSTTYLSRKGANAQRSVKVKVKSEKANLIARSLLFIFYFLLFTSSS